MKHCQIIGNRIHKIYTPEEAAWYAHLEGFITMLPDDVQEGWIYDSSPVSDEEGAPPVGWREPSEADYPTPAEEITTDDLTNVLMAMLGGSK